jgi:hypothetical protein
LQGLRTAVLQQAKSEITESVKEFAANALSDTLQNLLSGYFPNFRGGIFQAVRGFSTSVEDAWASTVPEPFRSYFWFEPSVRTDGNVENAGINARNLPGGARTFVAGLPRPDFLVNPSDPSSGNAETSYLIGDFTLSGNSLYKKYVNPGKQTSQWDAITNHARNFGLRISLFITFFEGEKGNLEELIAKKGLKEGDLVFVLSIKSTKKSATSWLTQ